MFWVTVSLKPTLDTMRSVVVVGGTNNAELDQGITGISNDYDAFMVADLDLEPYISDSIEKGVLLKNVVDMVHTLKFTLRKAIIRGASKNPYVGAPYGATTVEI